jgi:hypothetical protein
MKTTTLRELIRESIQGYIREIDMVSEVAAIESKIAEAKKAMEERNSKLAEAEKLNESGLIDEKKVKQLQKEVALLEKYTSKQEALLEKKKAKMKGKSKEVDDDMITEEPVEEVDGLEEMGYVEEEDTMEEAKEEEMKEGEEEKMEETLNESFLRMQKLAGLITETQYRKKIQILNEDDNESDIKNTANKIDSLLKTKQLKGTIESEGSTSFGDIFRDLKSKKLDYVIKLVKWGNLGTIINVWMINTDLAYIMQEKIIKEFGGSKGGTPEITGDKPGDGIINVHQIGKDKLKK